MVTLRYGCTRFQRRRTRCRSSSTRRSSASPRRFLSPLQVQEVPAASIDRHDYYGVRRHRPEPPSGTRGAANGTVSKLLGRHTFKVGADYRRSASTRSRSPDGAGDFRFDRLFTSSTPPTAQRDVGGNALRQLPARLSRRGEPGNQSTRRRCRARSTPTPTTTAPTLQDDWRVSPKLTLNYGLRLEHEDGLREENNGFTVAFDRTLNPGGALGASSTSTASRSRRPGLRRPERRQRVPGRPAGA